MKNVSEKTPRKGILYTTAKKLIKKVTLMKLVSDNAPKGSLQASTVGTTKFSLFMDKIFDSINARTINHELGKPLRSAVKNKSPHMDHWKYAIKIFEFMKFVNKTNARLGLRRLDCTIISDGEDDCRITRYNNIGTRQNDTADDAVGRLYEFRHCIEREPGRR
ncbi:hypothetical protein QTP88_023776 [Uroleucon formosanum]